MKMFIRANCLGSSAEYWQLWWNQNLCLWQSIKYQEYSPSAFPAISVGCTIFGEIFVYVTIFLKSSHWGSHILSSWIFWFNVITFEWVIIHHNLLYSWYIHDPVLDSRFYCPVSDYYYWQIKITMFLFQCRDRNRHSQILHPHTLRGYQQKRS